MNRDNKRKFTDWLMKKEPPSWIAAKIQCRSTPVDEPQRKTLFVINLKEIGYNKGNSCCDNQNLQKHACKKFSGEVCVEWFLTRLLELETYMKYYSANKIEKNIIQNPTEGELLQ